MVVSALPWPFGGFDEIIPRDNRFGGEQMIEKSVFAASLVIAAALVAHGYLTSVTVAKYQIAAEGETLWRVETTTGHVSLCGSIVTGPTYGRFQATATANLLGPFQNASPEVRAKTIKDTADMEAQARPVCTDWSSE
jgi:hypothetical protein